MEARPPTRSARQTDASPQVLAERLTAQLLAGPPARDPVAVAERLLAMQGQDPRGARLAVRARTAGLSAADVDRALTRTARCSSPGSTAARCISCAARTTRGCRRSRRRRCCTQGSAAPARRRACAGRMPSAASRTIERALAEEGPLDARAAARARRAPGVQTERQALVHILFAAACAA